MFGDWPDIQPELANMTVCPFDVYPYVYLRVLTLSWHIQTPFLAYSLYCIIFVSPKTMAQFKWHLLEYQIASGIMDFIFSMCLTPVVIPVITFGYSVGYFRHIMTCHGMMTISLIFLTIAGMSIVELFHYRFHIIQLPNDQNRLTDTAYYSLWVAIMTVLILILLYIHTIIDADQEMIQNKLSEVYSCIDFLFDQPSAYSTEKIKYIPIAIFGTVLGVVGIGVVVYLLHMCLQTINLMHNNYSSLGQRNQKRLIQILAAQVVFPLFAFVIGGSAIVITMTFEIGWMQQAFNLGIFLFANYGWATSISLIICNDSYFRHFKRLMMMDCRTKKKEVAIFRISDRSAFVG